MDLALALSWTAERFPGRAGVWGPRPLTYREWDAQTNRYARALAGAGARPGDRVLLLMSNGEPMASMHLAAQKLGAVSTPLNTRYGPDDVAYCAADARPAVVVTDDAAAGFLPALRDGAARAGVLCRCTGYKQILDAVREVSAACPAGPPPPANAHHDPALAARAARARGNQAG